MLGDPLSPGGPVGLEGSVRPGRPAKPRGSIRPWGPVGLDERNLSSLGKSPAGLLKERARLIPTVLVRTPYAVPPPNSDRGLFAPAPAAHLRWPRLSCANI